MKNLAQTLSIKMMSKEKWEKEVFDAIFNAPEKLEALLKSSYSINFKILDWRTYESQSPLTWAIAVNPDLVPLLLTHHATPNTIVGRKSPGRPGDWDPVSVLIHTLEHHKIEKMEHTYHLLRQAGGKLFGAPINEEELQSGQNWLRNAQRKMCDRMDRKNLHSVYEQWEAAHQQRLLNKMVGNTQSARVHRLKI